ncbi:hypothetical protein [Paraburkholderia rhynchosiae]|nr:hypothetical protein [Paraburkholderia rhynchosiae]
MNDMQPSDCDSLDWPLLCVSAAIALMSTVAISNDLFIISLLLLAPAACVAVWIAIGLFYAVKSARVLRLTSCLVAAMFAYFSAQWLLPGHDAVQQTTANFQFEGKRATYEASVANHKLADPKRNFVLFEAREDWQRGEVDRRIAYDETDTLISGLPGQVGRLIEQQSPEDATEFASCRWKVRHIDGHYYAVDFFC